MADQPTMTRAEFAQKIKAQYPVYASMSDDELASKMLAKYPVYGSSIKDAANIESPASASSTDGSTLRTITGLALAGAAKVAQPIADAALEFATSPAVKPIGAKVGEAIGAVTSFPTALSGFGDIAKGAYAGSRAGWFTAKLLQRLSAPAAKVLQAVAPYAEVLTSTLGPMAAEGEALTRLNDPEALKTLNAQIVDRLRSRMNAPDLANNANAKAGIAASIRKLGGTP